MLTILLACVSMAFKDMLGTFLTVAESRGRSWLAGALDAGYDIASLLTYGVAGVEVVKHGFSITSVVTLTALSLTSFFGTALWTKLGQRIEAAK